MNVLAIDNPISTTAVLKAVTHDADDFVRRLELATAGAAASNPVAADKVAGDTDADAVEDTLQRLKTLRKSIEQLVAITFIMPMLAQMRDDPFKSDMFHGGQTEEIFGQQMDTIFAERIVTKANFSIVDAVYRSIVDKNPGLSAQASEVDTHG